MTSSCVGQNSTRYFCYFGFQNSARLFCYVLCALNCLEFTFMPFVTLDIPLHRVFTSFHIDACYIAHCSNSNPTSCHGMSWSHVRWAIHQCLPPLPRACVITGLCTPPVHATLLHFRSTPIHFHHFLPPPLPPCLLPLTASVVTVTVPVTVTVTMFWGVVAMKNFVGQDAIITSDAEASLVLVLRAREGDEAALNDLMARYWPRLQRWAHGRLPRSARGALDTHDLVQDTLTNVVQHLAAFNPARGCLSRFRPDRSVEPDP